MATLEIAARAEARVDELTVRAYEVPTDQPESDGTLEWTSTTIIGVEAAGGDETGLGFAYGDLASATLVESRLAEAVEGTDVMSPPQAMAKMQAALRNVGRPGIGAIASSAVDIALWDLKARLLGMALADLLPRRH